MAAATAKTLLFSRDNTGLCATKGQRIGANSAISRLQQFLLPTASNQPSAWRL
jgi:hypothetical protein